MKLRKVVGALAVIAFLVLVYYQDSQGENIGTVESEISVQKQESEEWQVDSDSVTDTAAEKPDLYPIEIAEPNNQATNGYLEMKLFDGRNRFDVYKAVLKQQGLVPLVSKEGEKVKLITGHTIYTKENNENQYIVSGSELVSVTNGEIDLTDVVILRKEDSSERVRVFTSREDLINAEEYYSLGQKILSGETQAPERCVILNGSLIPDIQYELGDDGRIYIPMTDIAEAYDEKSAFCGPEGWLNVAVDLRYIVIPTREASGSVQEHFSVKGGKWCFQNETAPLWNDWFYLPKTDKTEMPLEDIARIFGWDISVGEGIVSIVTDSLDANNNFVLFPISTSQKIVPLEKIDG